MQKRFFVGLDLGQAHDYSALTVVERVSVPGAWDAVTFAHKVSTELRLRHVERIRLGTAYPDIVERTGAITRGEDLRGCCHLMVDATGVGRPVIDLLRRARVECSIYPAVITSGVTETQANGYYHVPKRDLIAGVQVALQTGLLHIAAGMKFIPALLDEMAEMRMRVSGAGRESFGAGRQSAHDDLVVALALSLWGVRKVHPRPTSVPTAHGNQQGWRGGG